MQNKKVAIAYVPVLHKGYFDFIQLLEKDSVHELYLISDEILISHEELDFINRKDRLLRALPHETVKKILSQNTNFLVESLTTQMIFKLHKEGVQIIVPKEDINEFIVETYFGGHHIEYRNVFLRRNKSNLGEDKIPEGETITLSDFQKSVVAKMKAEAEKSADWWRHVGAALVKGGEIIAVAHNEHMPEKELPNIIGDSRSLFKKGDHINYVTTAHAEAAVIADAAKRGVSTEGSEIFVTDFPCPYCARIIAKAGIKKLYYQHGYAVLGGDEFFKDMGIDVVRINLEA